MNNTLLLLHGALGSKNQFDELREKLSPALEIYDFNFSGHGGGILSSPLSIRGFVQQTIEFLNSRGLDAVHIFGYSMGGYVALQMAHDAPQRVQKILTLGTKFEWNPESAAREVRKMNPEMIEEKIPHFARTLRERHQPEDWKKLMRATADMMTRMGSGEAMTMDRWKAIAHPVLICLGSEDQMVTAAESEEIARTLPLGQYKSIPGLKHPIELAPMDVLAEICLGFFRDP